MAIRLLWWGNELGQPDGQCGEGCERTDLLVCSRCPVGSFPWWRFRRGLVCEQDVRVRLFVFLFFFLLTWCNLISHLQQLRNVNLLMTLRVSWGIQLMSTSFIPPVPFSIFTGILFFCKTHNQKQYLQFAIEPVHATMSDLSDFFKAKYIPSLSPRPGTCQRSSGPPAQSGRRTWTFCSKTNQFLHLESLFLSVFLYIPERLMDHFTLPSHFIVTLSFHCGFITIYNPSAILWYCHV